MSTPTLPHPVPNRKIECALLYCVEVEIDGDSYFYPEFALQWRDSNNSKYEFPGDLYLSENNALNAALLRLRDKAGYTPDYFYDLEAR